MNAKTKKYRNCSGKSNSIMCPANEVTTMVSLSVSTRQENSKTGLYLDSPFLYSESSSTTILENTGSWRELRLVLLLPMASLQHSVSSSKQMNTNLGGKQKRQFGLITNKTKAGSPTLHRNLNVSVLGLHIHCSIQLTCSHSLTHSVLQSSLLFGQQSLR